MKFTSTIALLASLLAVNASRVAWDSVYDNAGGSLSVVSCSDGPNGLLTKGYNVFKDLPTFPNIGAASAVAGWNSPNCGSSRFTKVDFVADDRGSLYNRFLLERHLSGQVDLSDGS